MQRSEKVYVFLTFFLYGIATTCICLLVRRLGGPAVLCITGRVCAAAQISVFFSKAKTALIIGLVLLFGSIFPYVAVSGASHELWEKVGVNEFSKPVMTCGDTGDTGDCRCLHLPCRQRRSP